MSFPYPLRFLFATQPAIMTGALGPILKPTLTTVAGMTPLAIGLGEEVEMLQPLAPTLIQGCRYR